MLRDSIQPFPTFSEVYIAALEGLHGQITTARGAARHAAHTGADPEPETGPAAATAPPKQAA